MKTSNNNLLQTLNKSSLENLTRETRETLAIGYAEKKSFLQPSELWNIQRHQKDPDQPSQVHLIPIKRKVQPKEKSLTEIVKAFFIL